MIKLFRKAKDGGPDSNVTGYWLIEWKRVFSIALLKFSVGWRENYHSHAFNSASLLFGKGTLLEYVLDSDGDDYYEHVNVLQASILPVIHKRSCLHRVECIYNPVWALTIRGPWSTTWSEFDPKAQKFITLTRGRKILDYDAPGKV